MNLYAVRNREGLWFRSRGRSGYGSSWVTNLEWAKLYVKLSQARSRVTYFTRHWPDTEPPEIVAFELVDSGTVLANEITRAKRAVAKIEQRLAKRKRRLDEWLAARPR